MTADEIGRQGVVGGKEISQLKRKQVLLAQEGPQRAAPVPLL